MTHEDIRRKIRPGVKVRTEAIGVLTVREVLGEIVRYEEQGLEDYLCVLVESISEGAWSFVEEEGEVLSFEGLRFTVEGRGGFFELLERHPVSGLLNNRYTFDRPNLIKLRAAISHALEGE